MKTSKKLSRIEKIIISSMVLFTLFLLVLVNLKQSKDMEEKMLIYRKISFTTSMAGNLKSIEMEMGAINKGVIFIDLSNNKKYSLFGNLWNRKYSPNNFYDFVQTGDSIYKTVNSTEIVIYRNKQEYHFSFNK